ncbi:MAG: hypothetical protein FWE80_07025 [Oscillospiraceae bacterium]|nr:hypothetical protein [Oscillospiraceae bacterium]
MKRFIILAVVILLTAALLGGCAEKKWSPGQVYKIKDEPEPMDLGGETIVVVDSVSTRWNRQELGTPYNDAWHFVLDNVEQKWNCKIDFRHITEFKVVEEATPEILAGDKFCDILCTTQWRFGHLIGADLMMDLNELSTDWDNIWWNQNIRKIATLNGKTYAANGSFNFDAVYTWLVQFNVEIWDELQLPDPYQLVEDGKWTMDLLMDYSKRAMRDEDGNGIVDTPDDRWGMVAWDGDFARALYMSSGNHYFAEHDGVLRMDMANQRSYDFVGKMQKYYKEDKSVAPNFFRGEPNIADRQNQMFLDGKSLFYSSYLGRHMMREMEADWGVLPMPKYDEDQEKYMSTVDWNGSVMGVTKTQTEPDKLGRLLDAIGFYAMDLEKIYWPDYEETYWRHDEDARIVAEYVCHSGQYDMALLMANANGDIFGRPMGIVFDAMFGNTKDFSSEVERYKEAIDYALDKYFEDLEHENRLGD